ncbi:hypothetical protein FXF69_33515 [Actinomadura chibensis]|uniref:Amine oxidase domain-containing protein n=1 Tax=Actinomadura chibensis TaxID=392828 RepID=A0A5D0NCE4_9ACTN|nr:hypothetical protein FXF69_33515 [Actinomadura chibensis]
MLYTTPKGRVAHRAHRNHLVTYGQVSSSTLTCAPHGRVHWAGADLSPLFPNQMEGALCSGENVAAEIIAEV